MRKGGLSIIIMTLCLLINAQTPEFFNYQAIVRNTAGEPLVTQDVIFLFSIIKTSPGGTVVYTEKHAVKTNEFGLVNPAIGNGTDKTGDFTTIDWGADNHYLKVQLDKGDAIFVDMGTTQMFSVPYALFAGKVQSVSGRFCYRDKDGDGFGYMYESVWVPDGTDPPAYYVINNDDCNDNDFYTQDGSPEICDGIDNDCNGLTDEFWPELGDLCLEGSGVCRNAGFKICDPGDPSGSAICNAAPGIPQGSETCNYLDDDCDGVVDNGYCDVNGKYYTDNACGNCYTDCQAIYNLPNAYGKCDNSGPAPVCIMQCEPGYFDLDQIPQNGCEFHFQEDAIYVSPNGEDEAGCGTGFNEYGAINACKSINTGLIEAVNQGKHNLLVANGLYNEAVNVHQGINLLGGYDPVTWIRNLYNSSTIISGTTNMNVHLVTITASNINQPTTISGFKIQGGINNNPSGNCYTIYVTNSNNNLRIVDNSIYGGDAGDGDEGLNGNSGQNGMPGNNGTNTVETYTYNSLFSVSGGSGGSGATNGGAGGGVHGELENISQQESGEAGGPTIENPGGTGGPGGYNRYSTNCSTFSTGGYSAQGIPGANGVSGSDGTGGIGGTNIAGSIISSHWSGQAGLKGQNGGDGSGGGGGGSGGGADLSLNCSGTDDCSGGTGGGGGGGAEGGYGGFGGSPGGGSFCIIILNSLPPVLENNTFYRGTAGNGGNGGFGGVKGIGGMGGTGGQVSGQWSYVLGTGGNGGMGGNGGTGGGGGGGTGGTTFGIYTYNTTIITDYVINNAFLGGKAGQGGSGGYSYRFPGQDGSNGIVESCSYH